MLYIASPYSHPDSTVRAARVEAVARIVHLYFRMGVAAFSPVMYSARLADDYGLPTDFEYWRDIDLDFLVEADDFVILKLPGWDRSVGIQEEFRVWSQMTGGDLQPPSARMTTPQSVYNCVHNAWDSMDTETRSKNPDLARFLGLTPAEFEQYQAGVLPACFSVPDPEKHLNACRFCGSLTEIKRGGAKFYVRCVREGCHARSPRRDTAEDAIRAHNGANA